MLRTDPVLTVNFFKLALLEPFLLTVIEIDLVVMPSSAVTNRLITVGLLVRLIACEAEPDVTASPLTVTVAFASLVVGVTVIETVDDTTDAV